MVRTSFWWRPFRTLGVLIGLTIVAGIIFGGVTMAVHAAFPNVPGPTRNMDDATNPADLWLLLGMLAALVPVALLASRWGAGLPRAIHSVEGRFRWDLLWQAMIRVVPFYLLTNTVLPLLFDRSQMRFPSPSPSIILVYIMVILLTPLQCAAEEYCFRALPQQAIGTWLRLPIVGILLPVPIFMAGHGYDWVGQIDIGWFGLCMGFLVWKTGGVEIPIVIHAANDVTAFLTAPLLASGLAEGAVSPSSLIVPMAMTGIFTIWGARFASKRYGVGFWEPVKGHGELRSNAKVA